MNARITLLFIILLNCFITAFSLQITINHNAKGKISNYHLNITLDLISAPKNPTIPEILKKMFFSYRERKSTVLPNNALPALSDHKIIRKI